MFNIDFLSFLPRALEDVFCITKKMNFIDPYALGCMKPMFWYMTDLDLIEVKNFMQG